MKGSQGRADPGLRQRPPARSLAWDQRVSWAPREEARGASRRLRRLPHGHPQAGALRRWGTALQPLFLWAESGGRPPGPQTMGPASCPLLGAWGTEGQLDPGHWAPQRWRPDWVWEPDPEGAANRGGPPLGQDLGFGGWELCPGTWCLLSGQRRAFVW